MKLTKGLQDLLSFHKVAIATVDDIQKGFLHGAILGSTGAYCFGPQGAAIGFATGLVFNLYNSPSNASWKKFVKKRVPDAKPQKRESPFTWQSSVTIGALVTGSLLLSKKGLKDFFDFSPINDLQETLALKKAGVPGLENVLANSIKETAGIAWKMSWMGYMVNEVNKTLSNGFLAYASSDVKKVVSSLKISFQSPEAREKSYSLLAEEKNPVGLYLLQKTFLETGREKEGLAAILNYYFKEDLLPSSPYGSHAGKKQLIELEIQKKSPLELFTTSLLLPVDKSLVQYYANLAIKDAKTKGDVAALALLATYQSYIDEPTVQKTWLAVAKLAQDQDILEEKVLGEGNSGGASQILFTGAQDDPLRWSLVTSLDDKKSLQGKYNLGKAIFPQTKNKKIFPTPGMISLQKEGNKYRLFRQQLWGEPLDEFTISEGMKKENAVNLEELYITIFQGIDALQDIYANQGQIEFDAVDWDEKFLSLKNNYYDKKIIEKSLDWLLEPNIQDPELKINHLPIIDPFVRNIGVHKKSDNSLTIPFWDVEPKGRAPRIYDYATLLLTAKPYLSEHSFNIIRDIAINQYMLQDSFSPFTTHRAYAGAVALRTISLVKAWSNTIKQPSMLYSRKKLLESAIGEMNYLMMQKDPALSIFAENNSVFLDDVKNKLDPLQVRFSR